MTGFAGVSSPRAGWSEVPSVAPSKTPTYTDEKLPPSPPAVDGTGWVRNGDVATPLAEPTPDPVNVPGPVSVPRTRTPIPDAPCTRTDGPEKRTSCSSTWSTR